MVTTAGTQPVRATRFRAGSRLTAVFATLLLLGTGSAFAADCRGEAQAGQDWSGCNRRNLMISGADLAKANLKETDLSQSDLRGANLTGADLEGAGLGRTSLAGASADGANFAGVEGYRTDLSKIAASRASFRSAELQRSSFAGATLAGSDFQKAELGRANFEGASLSDNDFAFANLARASLKGARIAGALNFGGAYMFLTRIEGVDLSAAKGLTQAQIDLTCGDGDTKLPQGLAPPSTWPCRFD